MSYDNFSKSLTIVTKYQQYQYNFKQFCHTSKYMIKTSVPYTAAIWIYIYIVFILKANKKGKKKTLINTFDVGKIKIHLNQS